MDFEFLNPPPLVEQKKKYANFTVKKIGGPEEIVKWREMQAAKESVYRMRLQTRDNRLSDFESTIGQKLDAPKVSQQSWADKVAFAESERVRLATLEKVATDYEWKPEPEPKKTALQRFTGFIASLWKNSNF